MEACRAAVEYINTTVGISAHVNISTRGTDVRYIESAHTMLLDAENSRSFYTDMIDSVFLIPEDTIIRIMDQGQRMQFEQTFFQTAERICGTVRTGEAAAVEQVIREQLLKIAGNCIGMPPPEALNMTVNRFISLMQHRLMEDNLADWRYLAERDFSRDLVSSKNLEEFLSVSSTMAEQLVEHARQRLEQHDSLMHEMYCYLEENATDMNIGLTAVSRTFHTKPREAAESFRRYFGESINDVIHKVRVKKAKEMILTTDIPVQEIAEAVGYCSLATMYRAFTNVEGVAPGKLRQNRGNG